MTTKNDLVCCGRLPSQSYVKPDWSCMLTLDEFMELYFKLSEELTR